MKKYTLFIPFILLLWGCPKTPLDEPIKKIRVKFNLIGITGTSSDTSAYIELFYTKADSLGRNTTVHKWVKPPYILGDHVVVTNAQKIFSKGHSDIFQYHITNKHTEGEAAYLKIINHSDKPIEYFIAGTQNFHYGNCHNQKSPIQPGCNCQMGINTSETPRPIYKNAPIYYLLRPDKVPNLENLQITKLEIDNNYSCLETGITFKGNKIGGLVVNNPFGIEDIMKLYRAEYSLEKDTILYAYFNDIHLGQRLVNRFSSSKLQPDEVLSDVYYGKILPKTTFMGSRKNPILNFQHHSSFGDFVIVGGSIEPEQW